MDGNGYISTEELNDLFKAANLPLPGYRIREIIQELSRTMDLNQDGKITFDEFAKVRSKVKGHLSIRWERKPKAQYIIFAFIHFADAFI